MWATMVEMSRHLILRTSMTVVSFAAAVVVGSAAAGLAADAFGSEPPAIAPIELNSPTTTEPTAAVRPTTVAGHTTPDPPPTTTTPLPTSTAPMTPTPAAVPAPPPASADDDTEDADDDTDANHTDDPEDSDDSDDSENADESDDIEDADDGGEGD